jgi:hypothetical protein
MEELLRSQGKLEWALEEFEAVRTAPPAAPRSLAIVKPSSSSVSAASPTRLSPAMRPPSSVSNRASGCRYGQRAFLVQLRREGTGTVLIDPEATGSLAIIDEALRGTEWVLHARGAGSCPPAGAGRPWADPGRRSRGSRIPRSPRRRWGSDVVCTFAGLPPVTESVTVLRR